MPCAGAGRRRCRCKWHHSAPRQAAQQQCHALLRARRRVVGAAVHEAAAGLALRANDAIALAAHYRTARRQACRQQLGSPGPAGAQAVGEQQRTAGCCDGLAVESLVACLLYRAGKRGCRGNAGGKLGGGSGGSGWRRRTAVAGSRDLTL